MVNNGEDSDNISVCGSEKGDEGSEANKSSQEEDEDGTCIIC